MLEGEGFQLPADLRHAEAVRERCVDLARLECNATSLVGAQMLECAHVVQPVRQLNENDARILRHRQQQLAVILDLLLRRRAELHFADLGHTVDNARDLVAELGAHFIERRDRILDDIVHQSGCD